MADLARRRLEISTLATLARKELRDALRNRWFVLYTIAFAVLAVALSAMSRVGTGSAGLATFGRTAAGLINLVILIIPLMALTAGAATLASERERSTLDYLLSQPVSRLEVLLGKYLGLATALLASLALGFGAGAIPIALAGGGDAGGYLRLVALAFVLALAMLSVGMLVSAIARRTAVAMGAAIVLWLALVFLGDLGLMGSAIVFRLRVGSLFGLSLLNPLQVFKMACLGSLNTSLDVLGPAGLYATRTFGAALDAIFLGVLAAWVLGPLGLAAILFAPEGRVMRIAPLLVVLAAVAATGCGSFDPSAPPDIVYGDDVCDVCGMIISDERFAASAVIRDDELGYRPLRLDDVGCLLAFERDTPGEVFTGRWVRDFESRTWLPLEDAAYVHSVEIRSPMAFGVAATGSVAAAETLRETRGGDVLDVTTLRERYRSGRLSIAGSAP